MFHTPEWRLGPSLPDRMARSGRGRTERLSGFAIHRQHRFADRAREIIVAKFSTQAPPPDGDAWQAVDAILAPLTGD